jgi:hypothetical protein
MYNIRPLVLANSLHGFHVHGTDGPVGRIDDFYFSDESWKIRHVVIDVGRWLPGRKVLVAPEILGHADWHNRFIEARTGRAQIRECPDAETIPSVAPKMQPGIYGIFAADPLVAEATWEMHQEMPAPPEPKTQGDTHLRSTRILKDWSIIDDNHEYQGVVSDFLIDTGAWEIRFMFFKTLMDSRMFLVAPSSVSAVDIENMKVTIRHPDDMKADWQEYNPHYMTMLEMQEK